MDHLKGQSTVFNQWKFYFKILVQYKVTVNFVNRDIQNICGHKLETMRHIYGLKICMGDKTHKYYKYTKFY